MLYRALYLKGKRLEGKAEFDDLSDVAEYAAEAVSKMGSNGLVNGYNGKFSPKNLTTRAEACAMLYNAVKYSEEVE